MADTHDRFPTLFSPLDIGPVRLKNRIASSGHATRLADQQRASDRFRAYHRARAEGGAGLIISEASFLSLEGAYSHAQLVNVDDGIIEGMATLAQEVHEHGCALFGQLLHLGHEQSHRLDGTRIAAPGPSAGRSERYHTAGRAMTADEISEVVTSFGDAAERYARAGLDGVEIAASHGYLLSQFLNQRLNTRTDDYGGSFENRLRLTVEILHEVRDRVGDGVAVGIRISGDEMAPDGLDPDIVVQACSAIGQLGLVDYFNIAVGSSRQVGGAVHIVSPMSTDMAISTPFSIRIKAEVDQPVLAVGRINHPSQAEQILADGSADLVAMTRALICDPLMPQKAHDGRSDEIRQCIACNQACIDRFHRGHGISCIQHPETGRELQYGLRIRTPNPRSVTVVGGGPAGMKAAAVAAERGHAVTLYERSSALGGQVRLAEQLPRRSEFGGIIPNLEKEMELAGVDVRLGVEVDRSLLEESGPDVVIVATGASPITDIGETGDAHVIDAAQILDGSGSPGRNVLVTDWRCDWTGIGIAEHLAATGHRVTLASTGHVAGEQVPRYVRDLALGELHRLGVELIAMVRFYGADEDTVYLQHMASGLPVIVDGIDTVVSCHGHQPDTGLEEALAGFEADVHVIGDCKAARTVEEAVLEGLEVATSI